MPLSTFAGRFSKRRIKRASKTNNGGVAARRSRKRPATGELRKLVKLDAMVQKFEKGDYGRQNIHLHFTYVGNVLEADGLTPSIAVVGCCNVCSREIVGDTSSASNLERHAKTVHGINLTGNPTDDEYQIDVLGEGTSHTPAKTKKIDPAAKKAMQAVFKRLLVYMIAVDGLPFSVVDGKGFRKVLEFANADLSVFSRRTVTQELLKVVEQDLKPKITTILGKLKEGTLHMTLDIWSSRRQQSVLGVRAQFIDENFIFHNLLLAFKHFAEAHTGPAILQKLKAVLAEFGLLPSSISSVCADNASNITKAVNMLNVVPEPWEPHPQLDLSSCSDSSETDSESSFSDSGSSFILDDGWDSWNQMAIPSTSSSSCSPSSSLSSSPPSSPAPVDFALHDSWIRKRCFCHCLQLVVNNSLKGNVRAETMVKRLNQWIVFLHRSPKWSEVFRGKSPQGLDLKVIGTTRWNSIFSAMERLVKDGMLAALKATLAEANTFEGPLPSEDHQYQMKELIGLLKPIKIATDTFQKREPVAHLVIGTLLDIFDQISAVQAPFFTDFKDELLEKLKSRFFEEVVDSDYVVAALLDPRGKTALFPDSFGVRAEEYGMFKSLTEERAIKHLTDYANRLSESTDPIEEEEPNPSVGLWSKVRSQRTRQTTSGTPECTSVKSEIARYLEEPLQPVETDVLFYWRTYSKKYPVLATLARQILGIPAASADVERMFSVAGSILRYRRSRMTIENASHLLTYKEWAVLQQE